jgi:UDPglucose 6-dehydrogenase
MSRRFSVVGLGKLGASMAAAIASRGHEVIGVDVNRRAVERVNAGEAPVQETGLEDLIAANRARLKATMSHDEAILGSDLTFVIVPTPSDARGAFSLQYAAFAFRAIGEALARKSAYHTVVLTSTVLPGATRYGLVPILERHSGKTAGRDFGVCYSPEFIALGSVIRDFLNPDFLLIGQLDERAGGHLEECYRDIMPAQPPVARMSLENAELAKISVNAFVTTKITFANLMAELCNKLPGGDVDVVSAAIGLDSRIGRKYLTGGLGYGGPCFPRDNVALAFVASALGVSADLPQTTDRLNRSVAHRIATWLRGRFGHELTVALLGLSYKPFSHGARVVGYDPLANESAGHDLGGRVLVLDSARECVRQGDVILLATPDPEFKQLSIDDFAIGDRRKTVVDFWRVLSPELACDPRIEYVPYGRGEQTEGNIDVLKALWSDATQHAH